MEYEGRSLELGPGKDGAHGKRSLAELQVSVKITVPLWVLKETTAPILRQDVA